jgi:hypothetical protein
MSNPSRVEEILPQMRLLLDVQREMHVYMDEKISVWHMNTVLVKRDHALSISKKPDAKKALTKEMEIQMRSSDFLSSHLFDLPEEEEDKENKRRDREMLEDLLRKGILDSQKDNKAGSSSQSAQRGGYGRPRGNPRYRGGPRGGRGGYYPRSGGYGGRGFGGYSYGSRYGFGSRGGYGGYGYGGSTYGSSGYRRYSGSNRSNRGSSYRDRDYSKRSSSDKSSSKSSDSKKKSF